MKLFLIHAFLCVCVCVCMYISCLSHHVVITIHAIAKSPTCCVAVMCFIAYSVDSSRLFLLSWSVCLLLKSSSPTPAFKNTMQYYQPSDYMVEHGTTGTKRRRLKMLEKHNMTDAFASDTDASGCMAPSFA